MNAFNVEKYYTSDELENGIENIPPISKTTQRNLRLNRKIKYTKLGRNCVYKLSWIIEYLESNEVNSK